MKEAPRLVINPQGDEREVPAAGVNRTPQVAYPDKKQVVFNVKTHFANMAEQQRLRKEAEAGQQKCEVEITTNLPFVLVMGTSDWHLGSEHTDYDLFWRHYNLIKDTPGVFVNVIGDERDNFVTPKLRAGLFEGVMNPQQQADMIRELLKDWDDSGKVLARVGGNHDGWGWEQSGVALENYWYREMKSPLMKVGGFEHLKVNGVEYLGFLHHGISIYNSTFNPNHASRRAFEMQGPYDFMMSGHVHQSEVAQGWRWSEEFAKKVIMCRTGTYKTEDTYSKSRQFARGQQPGACILFSSEEKRMMGFNSLEDGIEVMQAMNNLRGNVAQGMLGVEH